MSKGKNTLKTVAVFSDAMEAHIARGFLESHDIFAVVLHEHHIRMNWFMTQALGGVKLQVLAADYLQTQQLLIELQEGKHELQELEGKPLEQISCPQCDSTKVQYNKRKRGWALIFLYYLGLPISFNKDEKICLACKHCW